ncbi:MAG: hypothetical protein FE041_04005 [Thermoplasmata archaeon]|nr:MAG: hypothetical protein FE041_04005 [Thermoplasmata archaeon]
MKKFIHVFLMGILLLILFLSSGLYLINGEIMGLEYMLVIVPELFFLEWLVQGNKKRIKYELLLLSGAILIAVSLPLFIDGITEWSYSDFNKEIGIEIATILPGVMVFAIGILHIKKMDEKDFLGKYNVYGILIAVLTIAVFIISLNPVVVRWNKIAPYILILILLFISIFLLKYWLKKENVYQK